MVDASAHVTQNCVLNPNLKSDLSSQALNSCFSAIFQNFGNFSSEKQPKTRNCGEIIPIGFRIRVLHQILHIARKTYQNRVKIKTAEKSLCGGAVNIEREERIANL